jgi:hypothetical protein
MTYACPVWGFAPSHHINKLQIFQNKLLRLITKLPRVTPIATLHEHAGVPLIHTYIKTLATTFYSKTASSANLYIKNLGKYDTLADKYIRPRSILNR